MKTKLFAFCVVGLVGACQPEEYINPTDEPTGKEPPPATQIYAFDAAESPQFLDANLDASNALTAEYTVVNNVLVPMQTSGAFPESAGADADLQDGVGFGTYVNPDTQVASWADAGLFQSVLTANVILSQPGDAVKFCRTFATTCVTAQMIADGQGVLLLTLAANVPDTEIGEIATGISAAIQGTGENGLTIAVADPAVVAVPFAANAGTPFDLTWKISRGQIEGSLDYSVAVNDTELATGNTAGALTASIVKQGGVAMVFDTAAALDTKGELDYSYTFEGETPEFDFGSTFGTPVALSPQPGLSFTPLYVYPTKEPGYEFLTFSGPAGAPHEVQPEDALVGGVAETPGEDGQTTVYSVAFNGDDFAGTPFAGAVDQGIEGGGFYPSPALCYSQVLAAAQAQARQQVRQTMNTEISAGIAQANGALSALPAEQYTPLTPEDIAAIANDYADSNVDNQIATSVGATYNVVLNQSVSMTFVAQLGAFVEANPDSPLAELHTNLTTPNGSKEEVEAVLKDRILVTNATGANPPPPAGPDTRVPVLAAGCLWGAPPAAAGQPGTPPAREQAAVQFNALIVGIYGNFIGQAFGPTVPASNFSLSMEVGDTASGKAPGVSSIVISAVE
jgi:hypothetical protein